MGQGDSGERGLPVIGDAGIRSELVPAPQDEGLAAGLEEDGPLDLLPAPPSCS